MFIFNKSQSNSSVSESSNPVIKRPSHFLDNSKYDRYGFMSIHLLSTYMPYGVELGYGKEKYKINT